MKGRQCSFKLNDHYIFITVDFSCVLLVIVLDYNEDELKDDEESI